MIATLIGAGTALASAIGGAIGSANQNRKSRNLIENLRRENEEWYNMQKNQQYTQRLDFQAVMKEQKKLFDEQYQNLRGIAANSGATEEAKALHKKAANEALSDTFTNEAGKAQAYQDSVDAQYRQTENALVQQEAGQHANSARSMAAAASQGVSAGLNMIGADLDGAFGNGQSPASTPNPNSVAVHQAGVNHTTNQQAILNANVQADAMKKLGNVAPINDIPLVRA